MEAPPVENFSNIKFTLNTGFTMPSVGLGTFRLRDGQELMKVVDHALAAGYRLFAPSDHGDSEIVHRACHKSLKNLGLSYVDLYLIHFPGTARLHATDERNKKLREITWAAMEELYDEGLVNAIGVSNFTVRHLHEIEDNHGITPAVNQVEWHPFYHQPELLSYCNQKEIVLQAYSSFGGLSSGDSDLMNHPIVKQMAKKLGVTAAQLLLVWALQQDVAVIPKSVHGDRIKENIQLNFRIPEHDIKILNALGERRTKYAWDPKNVF